MSGPRHKSLDLPVRLITLSPTEEAVLLLAQSMGEATAKQLFAKSRGKIAEATIKIRVIQLHRKKLLTRLRKVAELSSDHQVLGRVNVYAISPKGRVILGAWLHYRSEIQAQLDLEDSDFNHKDA